MTGRVNPAIVSFLAGCHSGERLHFIDVRHLREQAHICFMARRNSRVRHDCFVNQKQEGLVAGVCWFSMTSVKLSADLVLMKEKESVEIRKRLLWEMKLIEWPKYSSVLGKRIVGSRQKNRRCSAKESMMLSKRIDDAKRKQSIYFKKSLNCYASLGSKAGLNKSAFKVFPLESSVTVWVVVAGPIDSSKE